MLPWAPSPPNPAPQPHPQLSDLKATAHSWSRQLSVQASLFLSIFIVRLYSAWVSLFCFPVVRILPCKGAPGSGSKPHLSFFFRNGTLFLLPQVTIPGLTDVSHPAGEKAAGGKLSFPFQPSAPTPPSRKAAQPLLLLHLGNGSTGVGGRVPSSAPLLPSGPKLLFRVWHPLEFE